MEYHEMELAEARKRIAAAGRNPDDFTFDLNFLPPDPDGAGMFTVQYEICATDKVSGHKLTGVGGIGMGWGDLFEQALKTGYFA